MMPFYKCTGGCLLEMRGIAAAFNHLSYQPGKDFQMLTISINPYENSALAATNKKEYVGLMKNQAAGSAGWHFMTGQENNITALGEAIGDHWVQDLRHQQFNHPLGVVIMTPQGKIFRYIYGSDYDPNDLKIALTKASQNQIGTVIDQVIAYCCTWNPTKGHYGLVIQRVIVISGCSTVAILVLAIGAMLYWEKKQPKLPAPGAGIPNDTSFTV